MLPTAGFIPPPVVPLVPNAINGIVATGGLLAGAAAASAAGAKAGAVFGPTGVVIGAVAGGLLLPLLLPQPTAPGTLSPPGLDPGLNDPSTETEVLPQPDTPPTPVDVPPGMGGKVLDWNVEYVIKQTRPEMRYCPGTADGALISPAEPVYTSPPQQFGRSAVAIEIELLQGYDIRVCGTEGLVENDQVDMLNLHLIGGADAGLVARNDPANRVIWKSTAQNGPGSYTWIEIQGITASSVAVPNPLPGPQAPTKPRINPIPLIPLPVPEPEPAPVPSPEPEPQPDPLEFPSPDNPEAPPIDIPKAPPAPPQEVPGPNEEPAKIPPTPTPVPPPLPVPGVPTVPEPSPEPNIAPVPSPNPAPVPGPVPLPTPDPGTDPGPGEEPSVVPTPVPPGAPGPGPIVTPISPEEPQAIDPGTGLVPQPIPLPNKTPTDQHFPVSGSPPVTSGGTRPDLSSIAAEVGRIEQKVAQLQNGGGLGDLADLLWLLPLLADFLEGDIPGTSYQLQGVCEDVQEGASQPVANFQVASAKNLGAVINRLDVMQDIFQQHLEWRTPICRGPKKEGEFRTISFISDELSAGGKRRLDKRFRYRSVSGVGLESVVNHWKDFVWSAGPVVVKHTDAPWGTPQVWAASIDEGKRVIRHAAGEAGFDPDKVGRWVIGGSNNPRYGVPGTMRVNTSGGYWWITARDGASERPQVVLSPPDL